MELTGTNRSIGLIVLSKIHVRSGLSLRRLRCLLNHIRFVDLVVLPGGPHPIPFRTRSLSPPGPMVLRLKARESRSPPGLPSGCEILRPFNSRCRTYRFAAGWSSPVARQAHNLKVTGSNPVPAPKSPSTAQMKQPPSREAFSFWPGESTSSKIPNSKRSLIIFPAVGWLIPAAFAKSAREAVPIRNSSEITVR